jgi:virulence factor Mce-like protein
MSRIKPRIAVNMVGVLILTVLTVGWVIINLVAPTVIDKPFAVTADFASSGGVFTNQEVTYRGVLIGKVGTLTLTDDGVEIELLIDPEWEDKIPSTVTARVQSKSAVGEQFVNLVPESEKVTEAAVSPPILPASAQGSTLSEDDEIPRSQTQLPVDFQKLLRTLDAVLGDVPPNKTRRLIHNLADGLGERGDEIKSILESLGTLSEAFASVAPEQQRLLDNATEAGDAFLDSKDEFVAAMKAVDDVLTGIGDEPQELKDLFVQNDRLARRGLAFIDRNGAQLHRGIKALNSFVDFQLDNIDAVEDSLTYVPAFLHAVEDSSIRWESPDGREFYRIRVGIVIDNQVDTWPCKYRLPNGYERFPHEREKRTPITLPPCRPQTTTESTFGSFVDALRVILAEEAARTPDDAGGGVEPPPLGGWLPAPPNEDPEPEPTPTVSPSEQPQPSPSSEDAETEDGSTDSAPG